MVIDIENVIISRNNAHKQIVKSDKRLSPKWLTQKSLQIIHRLKNHESSPTYLTLKYIICTYIK